MKADIKQALIQSGFLAASLLVCFTISHFLKDGFAIGCLAASCFIAFGFPNANSSRPRFLIGGYVCAILCGSVCAAMLHILGWEKSGYMRIVLAILSAFAASVLMLVLQLQHPPAAALAVAIVQDTMPLHVAAAAMGSVLLICCIKHFGAKILAGNQNPSQKE